MRRAGVLLLLCSLLAAGEVPFVVDGAVQELPGPPPWALAGGRSATPLAPVERRDGQLWAGGARLRLFGVNLTSGACFPDAAEAPRLAARLAAGGFNAVRLHGLDAPWGDRRLLRERPVAGDAWDAENLDRLERLVAALGREGLYHNLGLLIKRRFQVHDGVAEDVARLDPPQQALAAFFHEPLQLAAEAFAARLLWRRNPHTGLLWVEDPGLAQVEIVNEMGLLGGWLQGELDRLPPILTADLERRWNAWLAHRHPDPAARDAAWGRREEPPGAELLRSTDPGASDAAWVLERHAGARCESVPAPGGGRTLRVEAGGSEPWHVQLAQGGFALERGRIYTATLRLAADPPRRVRVAVGQAHAPWQALGLSTVLELEREPRTFALTFAAEADDSQARLLLSELRQPGTRFLLERASLRPGGRLGPVPAADGTLPILRWAERAACPRPLRLDWLRFLHAQEAAFFARARAQLEGLGVRCPIVGTQNGFVEPGQLAGFPLTDCHAYWEHPHFPGKPWDMENWVVRPRSMAGFPEESTLGRLAALRVAGVPHLLSEYLHPAPNPHAGEGPLFAAAYAGLQDWDGVFLYTWAHSAIDATPGRISGFFDIRQQPTVLASALLAAACFRRGDVAPARRELRLGLAGEQVLEAMADGGADWPRRLARAHGLDEGLTIGLRHRLAVDPSASAAPVADPGAGCDADTGEIAWRAAAGRGLWLLRSPRSKAAIGHHGGAELDLGDGLRLRCGETRDGWALVALCSWDGEPLARSRRMLLTASAGVQNSRMD